MEGFLAPVPSYIHPSGGGKTGRISGDRCKTGVRSMAEVGIRCDLRVAFQAQ